MPRKSARAVLLNRLHTQRRELCDLIFHIDGVPHPFTPDQPRAMDQIAAINALAGRPYDRATFIAHVDDLTGQINSIIAEPTQRADQFQAQRRTAKIKKEIRILRSTVAAHAATLALLATRHDPHLSRYQEALRHMARAMADANAAIVKLFPNSND